MSLIFVQVVASKCICRIKQENALITVGSHDFTTVVIINSTADIGSRGFALKLNKIYVK